MTDVPDSEKMVYNVRSVCKALDNISRPTFYRLVKDGELHTFKIYGKTYVSAEDLRALIRRRAQGACAAA